MEYGTEMYGKYCLFRFGSHSFGDPAMFSNQNKKDTLLLNAYDDSGLMIFFRANSRIMHWQGCETLH